MSDITNVLDALNKYVRSELMVLVFVFYFVIKMLKNSKMSEKRIPLTVCIISVLLCGVYTFAMTCTWTLHSVLLDVFSSITQGTLLAGCALYAETVIGAGRAGAKKTPPQGTAEDKTDTNV